MAFGNLVRHKKLGRCCFFNVCIFWIFKLRKREKKATTKSSPSLLVFVQHTERVQEGEVGSYTFKVFLRYITIMVMIVVPKDRLWKKKIYIIVLLSSLSWIYTSLSNIIITCNLMFCTAIQMLCCICFIIFIFVYYFNIHIIGLYRKSG